MERNFMTTLQDTFNTIWAYVPSLVGALAILVIGWIAAGIIARLVRTGVEKTGLVGRVSRLGTDISAEDEKAFEEWIGRGVFLILMLFVLVGFFQVLGLSEISRPLNSFLNEVFQYLPRLIGPVILILIAWIVAKLLRMLVVRGIGATRLQERLQADTDLGGEGSGTLAATAGEAVYWLTFLVFLPAILSSLELEGLLGPVRVVVDELLGYLPNLLAAALILFIGWFAARILRKIVANLLAAIGTDGLSERIGLRAVLGDQTLSGLIALIVYVVILIPVIIAALNALELNAITQPASLMLNKILAALPNLFAGALILVVSYVVAKLVSSLVAGLLAGFGFDTLPQRLGLGGAVTSGGRTPSEIAGFVLLVAIMLFATVEALDLIGFSAVADLVSQFLVFTGHIIVGLFIFGLGLYLAQLAAKLIKDSSLPNADLLATLARIAIIVLALAMGLGEMGLGDEIVGLAFGLTLGAIAVALAIAFGLGGRDAAARIVAKWTDGTPSTGGRPRED
jgi:hypothetical protein